MYTKPVPEKLYKYQPPNDQAISNIEKRCLWLSKPEHFNDPFDCDVQFNLTELTSDDMLALFQAVRKDRSDKEHFDKLYLQQGKPNDAFKQFILDGSNFATENVLRILRRMGVTCFSETYDNILMWSHYADKHQGFCLEFDTHQSPFKETEKRILIDVAYPETNLYPSIGILEILNHKVKTMPLITTKSKHWAYEHEWRMFSDPGDQLGPFDPKALSAIYFGCRIQDSTKIKIKHAIGELHIPTYQARKSETEFALEFYESSL